MGGVDLLQYDHGVPDVLIPELHPHGRLSFRPSTTPLNWAGHRPNNSTNIQPTQIIGYIFYLQLKYYCRVYSNLGLRPKFVPKFTLFPQTLNCAHEVLRRPLGLLRSLYKSSLDKCVKIDTFVIIEYNNNCEIYCHHQEC